MRALVLTLLAVVLPVAPSVALAATIVYPVDSGTVGFDYLTGQPFEAPVGSAVQSTCESNSYRMGFMEFLIPAGPGIRSATLRLETTGGSISGGWPPAVHELSWYEADLDVNLADFHDSTTLITTFETYLNVSAESFQLDVTQVVRKHKGRPLGFRLAIPSSSCVPPNGEEFQGPGSLTPVLEIQRGGRSTQMLTSSPQPELPLEVPKEH